MVFGAWIFDSQFLVLFLFTFVDVVFFVTQEHCGEVEHDDDFGYECSEVEIEVDGAGVYVCIHICMYKCYVCTYIYMSIYTYIYIYIYI